ncbi:hypothetical protein [Desulfogranum marinum]|uniref:hypothetical protein n=1 Tax=Desulfogranum marinum TaxID=453220 RepID=UPI0019642589|nr:hypothetical protein [Desulfogranum marinum]MBM9515096.1 hypothetical protein [Desulfogranum marinum]
MLGLKRSITGKQSSGVYAQYANIFDKLDVLKTAKKLDLVKKGQITGQSNKPATESQSNDENENRIISIIEEEKDKSYEEAIKWFSAYHERVKSLGVDVNINQLQKGEKKITTDIRAVLNTLKDSTLYKLQIDIGKKKRELNEFRKNNLLTREPRYSDSKVWGISIIILILAIESSLNGYFFAQGHSLGYLGGITQATIISIANIIFNSCLLGWVGLRQITHQSVWRKLLGVSCLLALIAFVPTFNLFVAHYRQAFVMQVTEPGMAAIETFKSSPFQLYDFDSYLLILMGVSAFLIATIDLWKIYDPYPGYEFLDQRLNKLKDQYVDNKAFLVEELTAERDNGFSEIQQALVELTSKQEDYRMLISKMEHLKSQLVPHFARLEQSARELLAIYREANVLTRDTPPPARWQCEYELAVLETNSLHMPTVHDVSQIVEMAQEALPKMMAAINDECSNAIDKLELLGTINDKALWHETS